VKDIPVVVSSEYLAHGKGTRFYEVALFATENSGRYVMVRRWGPASHDSIYGGGATKISSYVDEGTAKRDFYDTQADKRDRGYLPAASSHRLLGMSSLGSNISDVYHILRDHYSNVATVERIMHCLGLEFSAEDVESDGVAVDSCEIIEEGNDPEPCRSEDWGSW
jgi:predicted DNA-binding WGR domain protein